MHEMSIATALLEGVIEAAERAGASRVTSVVLQVGAFKLVVPEAMQMAWEAVREGTLADGATLHLEEVPAEARCRRCDQRFRPEIDYSFLCPQCEKADVEIVAGDDIVLRSLEFETEDTP